MLHLPEQDKAIYVWGRMAHPQRSGNNLLRWCVDVVDSEDLRPLAQLIGLFVMLIDDRRAGAIHMFSDVMGVRPWFVTTDGSRLICGSSVWPISGTFRISPPFPTPAGFPIISQNSDPSATARPAGRGRCCCDWAGAIFYRC